MEKSKFLTAVISLTATVLYFGLAVCGGGGMAAFFSHGPLIGLAVATLGLLAAAQFTQGSLSKGVREDKANRWVLWVFLVIGLMDGYVPALADRQAFWVMDGDSLRWCGVFLVAAGGVLRLWPVFVLGKRFSGLVAIQPGHALATHGIYKMIRNPSYLGLLVFVLGWGLAFNTWVGVILATAFIPPLIGRMRAEERLLLSQFGAEYEAYRARTWRLIPWIY